MSAVEFGLVAVPFMALIGAIVQTAFMVWAQQNLEIAFGRSIRDVFTGSFQKTYAQTLTPAKLLADLQNKICGSGLTVFDCSGLKIDLTLGSNFATSTPAAPVNAATGDWNAGFGTHYTCAPPGSIVVATAAVKFPLFFGLWNAGLSSFSDGSTLLQATTVFKTEPYAASGASPC